MQAEARLMHAPFEAQVAADASNRVAELDRRFDALIASHRDRAWRLAWRLLGGDEAAADDVTQDALVRAYRALAGFRDESKLETWFFRILVRQAHSYRRWRAVRELWHAPEEVDAADPEPAAASDPLLRRRIVRALDRLTASQRDAFVLVHLEGFSVREAAEIMRKAEGTVKSHLQRALQALRRELEDLSPRREVEA
jgi:RNA polymerase sigma-70 factor (ECF subfamily)